MLKYSFIRFVIVLLPLAYSLGSCGGSDPPTGPGDPPVNTSTVVLTNPVPGDTIGDSLTLEATATNGLATSRVEFYLNDSLIPGAVDSVAPYEFFWSATGISDGQKLMFSARAVDTSSIIGEKDSAVVTYLWSSATLTNPISGGTLGDSITLKATTIDALRTSRVEFLLNDSLLPGAVDSVAPYEFFWSATCVGHGQRLTFSVRAIDTVGAIGKRDSASVIYLWPSRPSVTYPPPRATIGDTMTILTDYTAGKPIAMMSLLNNGYTVTGMIDSVAPFSFFLDSIPADTGASLFLSVQAIDSNGNHSESDIVVVHNRWQLMDSDSDEAWPRDIRFIWSRSTNNTIEFRVETYDPWTLFGSQTDGVDIVFYMDIDQNSTTGDRSTTIGGNTLSIGDIGADYRAIVGNHGNVLDRYITFGGGQWVLVHDGTGFAGGDLSDSSNVMELDIFLNRIGNPTTRIDVVIGNAYLPGNVIDWAPNSGHVTVDLTRPVLFVP